MTATARLWISFNAQVRQHCIQTSIFYQRRSSSKKLKQLPAESGRCLTEGWDTLFIWACTSYQVVTLTAAQVVIPATRECKASLASFVYSVTTSPRRHTTQSLTHSTTPNAHHTLSLTTGFNARYATLIISTCQTPTESVLLPATPRHSALSTKSRKSSALSTRRIWSSAPCIQYR